MPLPPGNSSSGCTTRYEILCFCQFRIRRERIHAFRKVHEPPGFDESKNDDFCVGNAFMHSASVTSLSGYVEWKNVGQHRREWARPMRRGTAISPTVWMDYFLFNELRMFISLSERINPFPTQNTTFFDSIPLGTCDQGGTHKCVPYENSVNAPYAALS